MAMAAGALLDIGGNALAGTSAEAHKAEFQQLIGQLPELNPSKFGTNYFGDLSTNLPAATDLSSRMAQSDFRTAMNLREQALPGITAGTTGAMAALSPLMAGQLPPSVMAAYQRAGGASTVGSGFGGSGFGFLNTGLFGARGALGAIQTGIGLLPTLLSAMPHLNTPSPSALLGNLMTPNQVANMTLQQRQQLIGIDTAIAGMPTQEDVWAAGMKQAGGMLMGGGMGGIGGGSGGGFGGFGSMFGGGGSGGGFGGFGSMFGGGGSGGATATPGVSNLNTTFSNTTGGGFGGIEDTPGWNY